MDDLGIRRETKKSERRAPLTPAAVEELVRTHRISVTVQPSQRRAFTDDEYRAAGATVGEDLEACRMILGVKEIPPGALHPGKPHLTFFHVIKGQSENLPTLHRALASRVTLLDYERIVDAGDHRKVGFGRFAGCVGLIDGLWALGRRLAAEGVSSPFAEVRQALEYRDLDHALDHLDRLAATIRRDGVPPEVHPCVVGVTGGGRVASGAGEMLDRLPVTPVAPDELPRLAARPDLSPRTLYQVVFRRADRVDFARHLPHLTLLVNGIFWKSDDPRLVTWSDLERLWEAGPPRLRVIADLSCDREGAIEANTEVRTSDDPVYVAELETRRARSGVEGRGPVVLAVDNLPTELPADASRGFAKELLPWIPPLVRADFSRPYGELGLPPELGRAVIAHHGELAPEYGYLEELLAKVPT